MMNNQAVKLSNDLAEDLGIHFEWAGGESLTVRIVSNFNGNDIDVFTMGGAEPVTLGEVWFACREWLAEATMAV